MTDETVELLRSTEVKGETMVVATENTKLTLSEPDSDITFFGRDEKGEHVEMLRLCGKDGAFKVKGNVVTHDMEIYEAFKLWVNYWMPGNLFKKDNGTQAASEAAQTTEMSEPSQ